MGAVGEGGGAHSRGPDCGSWGGGRLSCTMLLSLQMGICVGLMQITYKTFVFICTWGMYVCEGDIIKKYEGVFTILHSNFK